MPVEIPRYDVVVRIDAAPDRLGWPKEGAVAFGIGNNRTFEDLRTSTWAAVSEAIQIESEVLDRCLSDAGDSDEFEDLLSESADELYDSLGTLLDFGTVAATLALNAAGCPTFTSCSGHHL